MACLLSQPLLGHSDPAAWHPVSEWQAHSQLPLGAAALRLFALEQTSLRLIPLWQGHGSALPQQLCKCRGGSSIGEEQGCLWAGGCSVWAAEQTWSQLSKEKGRDVLSKTSFCWPAVFCGRLSVHYSHISHSKKKKKGFPGFWNVEYAVLLGKSSIITLLIPSACCFSVKKNTIIPIPIPAQSYISFRTHFSLLPQMGEATTCRCISGE